MTNRLAHENSPYLLQHAENPVDWYPWGEEALERARQEDKPIFLSVGYAACHWCHVMEHESFEDPEVAAIMNEHFINIKVDREERPDIDSIYMDAVVTITGQGGWPMSVFMTSDGKPFFGGTYYPPVRRYNMPSFREVLLSIANAWNEKRDQLLEAGQEMTERLQGEARLVRRGDEIDADILEQAAFNLAQNYDWKTGGWGRAPKFPQPMVIEFLLKKAARGDKMAKDAASHLLQSMAKGGMYDVVGGGFARYSVDDHWLVPHFEKMLYDNAQLAQVYLYAALLTGQEDFRRVCEETLDFVVREMRHPEGGFYSSLDADSEGEEGKFYVWTPDEIRQAIEDEEDVEFILAAYNVTEAGNFEDKNIFQRALDDEKLAEKFKIRVEEVPTRLKILHQRLLEARSQRVRPGTDDKVLVSWNGMMLAAFAEAARYLKRADYLETARQNAEFLLEALHPGDRLLRSWREGQAAHNAYLEDYAALILGLLALYQSDPDPKWYRNAEDLAEHMVVHFRDPKGGFYDTRHDHEPLLRRPKDLQDNATPSGNSLASLALLQLAALSGKGEWRDMAEEMVGSIQQACLRYPTSFGKWLSALDFVVNPVIEAAILGDLEDSGTEALVTILWETYRPHLLAAVSPYPPPDGSPALLKDRPLKDDLPTVYLCENFVCRQPITNPEELRQVLNGELEI
jgi:uncharacterized protein